MSSRRLSWIAAWLALACSDGGNGGGAPAEAGAQPQGASADALVTAVDGANPWSALGDLTGSYSAVVTALESGCAIGPDVPFDPDPYVWSKPFAPFSEPYAGTVEQRGDDVVFELGEGLVFASVVGGRLVDVVRVGADGVQSFDDGFDVAEAGDGFLVSGESDWTFSDEHWNPGEVCRGRSSLALDVRGDAPTSSARDLHIVLRWPVASGADLDLLVQAAYSDQRAFLGEVQSRCHVLRSSGTAGAADDSRVVGWVRPLRDTKLPHHEEVIRCAEGSYGRWRFEVVNWSAVEPVDFAVEIFEGPSLGVDPTAERALALLEESAAPHSLTSLEFDYVPPPPEAGVGAVIVIIARKPAERPLDPISHSVLGFNKAAALDVSYDDFLANVGLF
jgi:hypothetical protein